MTDYPTMQAMEIIDRALRPVQLPIPTPGLGEVLVRVQYIGINRADVMQVAGSYPPPPDASPLPGLEVSGTIAALGTGVTGWTLGAEVGALLNGGGYAEYVTARAAQLLPRPAHCGMDALATLPEAAATSVMALVEHGKLQSGERILLHGGSSGVGLIMGQFAKYLGADVFATVGGPKKCAFVAGLGMEPIDHQRAPFAQQVLELSHGVDLIVDILGGPALADHLKLLRPGGRLVSLAMLQGSVTDSLRIGGLLMKQLTFSGAMLRAQSAAQKAALIEQARTQVWPAIEAGTIKPVIDRLFPLHEAEKAHARMQQRLHCGKILLEVRAN